MNDNVTPGSWNSKVGTEGSNIKYTPRKIIIKIF